MYRECYRALGTDYKWLSFLFGFLGCGHYLAKTWLSPNITILINVLSALYVGKHKTILLALVWPFWRFISTAWACVHRWHQTVKRGLWKTLGGTKGNKNQNGSKANLLNSFTKKGSGRNREHVWLSFASRLSLASGYSLILIFLFFPFFKNSLSLKSRRECGTEFVSPKCLTAVSVCGQALAHVERKKVFVWFWIPAFSCQQSRQHTAVSFFSKTAAPLCEYLLWKKLE